MEQGVGRATVWPGNGLGEESCILVVAGGDRDPWALRPVSGVRHQEETERRNERDPGIFDALALPAFLRLECQAEPFDAGRLPPVEQDAGTPDPGVVACSHEPRKEIELAVGPARCPRVEHPPGLAGIVGLRLHYDPESLEGVGEGAHWHHSHVTIPHQASRREGRWPTSPTNTSRRDSTTLRPCRTCPFRSLTVSSWSSWVLRGVARAPP